jgi:hypothetical protein
MAERRRLRESEGLEGRSERPAMWQGHPRAGVTNRVHFQFKTATRRPSDRLTARRTLP